MGIYIYYFQRLVYVLVNAKTCVYINVKAYCVTTGLFRTDMKNSRYIYRQQEKHLLMKKLSDVDGFMKSQGYSHYYN